MNEANRRWIGVLAGAVCGCGTGISALLLYTNGLFVADLSREFGLTRTQFGLGVLLVTLALAAANPLVGWAVDRFGAKRPALFGLLLLSLGFVSLSAFVHSVSSYLMLQAALAFMGAASGPIAYTKIIGATFDKHRGLALGVTMTGIGCAAALVPPILASVIATHGWRTGFLALSLIPLIGILATALFIPGHDATPSRMSTKRGAGAVPPATAGRWAQSRTFWVLAAAFAMMSLSFAGFLPHFVPLLTDGGLSPIAAGRIAGEIGLAVIASRLLIGVLMDRLFAPRIALAICVIAASGFIILMTNGIPAASITAIALGFAMGAELDLMGFLVARYFGLAEFGRIYGCLYGAFIFASGLGPLWVGALRDATGSYTLSLAISVVGLGLACVGFLLLPRYEARDSLPTATTILGPARSDFAEHRGP